MNHVEKKPHNTAQTSRLSFQEINQNGQRVREKERVLDALRQHQPLTSRSLSQLLKIERTNITRSLNDLENDAPFLVKVAFEAKCPITKRLVKFYSLTSWTPQQGKLNL
jgi:DNA-binding MarR family transcriptional regulator